MRLGDRVKIHPASDWFMRGVTVAIVRGFGRTKGVVRLECQRTRTKFRLHENYLMDMDGNVIGKGEDR